MIYLDTSFIAPLIISEASSEMVEKAVAKAKPGELITSQWTCVEIAGLISRKLLMGELDGAEAALVRRELQVVLDESIQTISPTSLDFDSACDYLEIPKTGLRSGDALHLAVAANRSARKIWSLDLGFVKAGKLLNLPVSSGR